MGVKIFLNGKQYMISIHFSTQNLLIIFSISYTVPEINFKNILKHEKNGFAINLIFI